MSNSKRAVLLKVLLMGDSNVGKTSIFRRYVKGDIDEGYKATIGADFYSKDIKLGDRDVILQIWDTAGQERYRSIGQTLFRGSDACIIVYDICDKESFDSLPNWVERFLDGVGVEAEDAKDSGLIFVVVGNKSDMKEGRQVDSNTALGFCNSRGYQFYQTSAKTGFQVSEAFEYIARTGVEKFDKQALYSAVGAGVNIDDDLNDVDETPGAGGLCC